MEISSAIQCRIQLPFSHQIPNSSKLSCPLPNSSFSLHLKPHFPLKSPHQHFCALSDDTSSSLGVVTGTEDSGVDASSDASFALKKKASYVSADLKGVSIFLIGMNSTMKSKVGQALAESLRYYFFDSDSLVEEAAGKDSSDKSFKERDEDGFRESETEVLKQLSSMGRLVVNAGNGAVQSVTNMSFLRHGICVWIDVPLDMIAKEFIGDDDQSAMSNISTPDSFSEELARLTQLYEEHRERYATADATISLQTVASLCAYDECDHVTAEDMALETLKEIEKLTTAKKLMEEAKRPF